MKNLKKLLTKNAAISLLISTNLMAFAYIIANKKPIEPAVTKPLARTNHGKVETAALLKNDEKLQICYQNYLKKEPTIDEGSLRLHMTIKKNGTIDHLKLVETDLKDEDFTNCILQEVKKRRLPPTPERLGVLISHKFNFSRRTVSSVDY